MTASVDLVRPAFHTAPPYDFTLGPEVGEFCASVGYNPDPEQQLGLDDIFAEDEHDLPVMGSYAVVGPRRNIKTGLEIQTAMGWLYVLEVPRVHYSAHKWKTAEGTFNVLSEIIRNSDDLSRQMLPSRRGTGYSQLRWRAGAEMTFTTRTLDGGRGEETDKHILDEALKLRQQHVGALLPALATRRLAQVVYGSSAGQATSVVLRDLRDRGRAGGDPTLGYLEYCAPLAHEEIAEGELVCDQGRECTHRRGMPGCGMDKPHVIAAANSQYGRRIPPKFFVSMRADLPPAEFGREFLGWWDEPEGLAGDTSPIDIEAWRALDITQLDEDLEPPPVSAFAIEMDLDHARACITAVGQFEADELAVDGEGRDCFAEFIEARPGQNWTVSRCVQLNEEHGPAAFVVDGGGPAAPLIPQLEEAGLDVVEATTSDVIEAYADLLDAIKNAEILHGPQVELDDAVEAARKRRIGDRGYTFDRRATESIPIIGVALAKWGMEKGTEPSVFFFADLDDEDDQTESDDDEWVD